LLAQTFKESIKAKWLLMFTVAFLLLVINIPLLVLIGIGDIPTNYLATFLSTLVTVSFPFLPLLALPMGSGTIVDERESGTLEYIMSNPISRGEFILGRLGGLLLSTTAVVILGYGIATMSVYSLDISAYPPLVTTMIIGALLNGAMVGVAFIVSILSKRKSTALGISIFLWFLLSVVANVQFLSLIINLTFGPATALPIIFLNPIELATTLATLQIGTGGLQAGSSVLYFRHFYGEGASTVAALSLVAWFGISLAVAFMLFRHRDIV
jgi:ABC-type transport system involved in multi-copper enzyme maturation permease subunit